MSNFYTDDEKKAFLEKYKGKGFEEPLELLLDLMGDIRKAQLRDKENGFKTSLLDGYSRRSQDINEIFDAYPHLTYADKNILLREVKMGYDFIPNIIGESSNKGIYQAIPPSAHGHEQRLRKMYPHLIQDHERLKKFILDFKSQFGPGKLNRVMVRNYIYTNSEKFISFFSAATEDKEKGLMLKSVGLGQTYHTLVGIRDGRRGKIDKRKNELPHSGDKKQKPQEEVPKIKSPDNILKMFPDQEVKRAINILEAFHEQEEKVNNIKKIFDLLIN